MAALVVQSRFAGLKIEDDDYPPSEAQKPKKKPSSAKKPEPPKKIKSNTNTTAKSQTSAKKKKCRKDNQDTAQQWEQWKQKDEQMVDGNFEDDLEQAILLSKLDYEEKKDVYKQLKKEAELEKKTEKASTKKQQKKKNVMSLEQFNDMVSGDDPKQNHQDEPQPVTHHPTKAVERDEEFFNRVQHDAKNELLQEKIKERVRNQKNIPDEVITRVQFTQVLERKDKEIAALKQEVHNLKQELLTVKSRNKKLCSILGQGEMKDKAEVLVEVERLRGVQAELMAEMESLHSELQKERSRNGDPRTKDRSKPKTYNIHFDVSSEAMLVKEFATATA